MRLLLTVTILFLLHLSPGNHARAGNLTFISGEELPGEPVDFDFEKKTITVTNPLTGKNTIVPTENLSLRSRQRLLFSPLFHRADTGQSLWPPEKRRLLFKAIMLPSVILFFGFWVSSWLIAGKANPLLALIGFLGSWIIVAIFAVCYGFFFIRFGGGLITTLFGIVVTMAFTPLYVSAVYNCSYQTGNLVFYFHLIASLCLLSIGMVLVEAIAGDERVDAWWNRTVFEPLGLIGPTHREVGSPLPERDSKAI